MSARQVDTDELEKMVFKHDLVLMGEGSFPGLCSTVEELKKTVQQLKWIGVVQILGILSLLVKAITDGVS